MKVTISPMSPHIEYTGRWEITDSFASSSACGSSFRLGFTGKDALLTFDVSKCMPSFPHIYLSVDGGALTECAVDHFIRVWAEDDGDHTLKVILKSALETQDRWHDPIACAVFTGCVDTEPCAIEKDQRPVIEFVGDSITEGNSVYPELIRFEDERWNENLVYTNDVCSSYSYLTAELLDFRAVFMGYGSTGVTTSGGGGVPRAALAYPYIKEGLPYTGHADHVVLNHGANDRDAAPEEFITRYRELLDVVLSHNPKAQIWAVSPFCGTFSKEISNLVKDYNRENGTNIKFVDTTGWIPAEPLHPSRENHFKVALRLSEIIRGK